MQRLRLRRATIQDLDRIMELEVTGFDPGNREGRDVYARRIAVFPDGALVGELDSGIAGCIFCEIWPDAAAPTAGDFRLGHDIGAAHRVDGKAIYICSMTIDPRFRGQRLGNELFNGCIEYLRKGYRQVDHAILLVNETWLPARKIYEDSGFRTILVLPGFFQPFPNIRQDGIVMAKTLQ